MANAIREALAPLDAIAPMNEYRVFIPVDNMMEKFDDHQKHIENALQSSALFARG